MFTQILIVEAINRFAGLFPCTAFKALRREAPYDPARAGTLANFRVARFPSGQNFVISHVKAPFVRTTPCADLCSSTHISASAVDVTQYRYINQNERITCSKRLQIEIRDSPLSVDPFSVLRILRNVFMRCARRTDQDQDVSANHVGRSDPEFTDHVLEFLHIWGLFLVRIMTE